MTALFKPSASNWPAALTLDFEAKGVIWFDDLSLTRQRLD